MHIEEKNQIYKNPTEGPLKKLKIKPSREYKGLYIPHKPPRITGYLIKIGRLFGGKNKRYFGLNPVEGNLIKYKLKQDYPINTKEMYDVSAIQGLTRTTKNGTQRLHYFEV